MIGAFQSEKEKRIDRIPSLAQTDATEPSPGERPKREAIDILIVEKIKSHSPYGVVGQQDAKSLGGAGDPQLRKGPRRIALNPRGEKDGEDPNQKTPEKDSGK